MKKISGALALLLLCVVAAAGGAKATGTTSLKDLKPAGTPGTEGKKNKKTKQQFDFIFEASAKHYTCRTEPKTSVNATDFVVGSNVSYEIDGDKVKLKNAAGKQVKCVVVRVENISAVSGP